MNDKIIIKGLRQNNLKNISIEIPKNKLVVFTGVSGSGKSSIVFDTIAAESQRQMNETYPAFVRTRLPKHEKPHADYIDNLTASVVIDQSRLGGNMRSTVGTITDMYSLLRLLFSRIGLPQVGSASYFSFNNPNGMCPKCSGIGKIMKLDLDKAVDKEKSWNDGMVLLPAFAPGKWYFRQYTSSGKWDLNKKFKDYSEEEKNLLLYGIPGNDKVEGIANHFERLCLMKKSENESEMNSERIASFASEETCPLCGGKRLNERALSSKIAGYNIYELSEMEFSKLREVIAGISDERVRTVTDSLIASLDRLIEIGLPYLNMSRESVTLSGGESQRLKLVRYMGSSLTGMTYIFDEPSTGMHPRDVYRMSRLLKSLRDKGNTVLVVEHDKDIIQIADEIIDVGPFAGKNGGQILFQGSYKKLLKSGTKTGNAMKEIVLPKENPRKPKGWISVRGANLHNLKNVSVDIPLGVLTCVTGVAGSGKSTLITKVFAKENEDKVVLIDQTAITVTGRSTACTYLGFFDEIRKLFAEVNNVDSGLFSFNGKGKCPACKGRGVIVTELIFMDPIVTTCEECEGKRYSKKALDKFYNGRNIVQILDMSVEDALVFFEDCLSRDRENRSVKKVIENLLSLIEVGLPYLSLGQPLSTLSGGERQRVKLAKNLHRAGSIFILDEPTTGLHASDIKPVMELLEHFVDRGNTVIVIEHNTDVMKLSDYIIDVGPDGGKAGGEIVFTGTPKQMIENGKTITAEYLRK
ncbi:MAG: excinuclease ABC subunit UvrA [Treponema sp.]|nr:excinuclease ABC subunit UvrA [Treponema sp.]